MSFGYETQVIFVLGICLVSAYLLNLISRRFKFPLMIAPLLVGLMLNFFFLEKYLYWLPEFTEIVSIFANFGIIVILFFIGLGVDFRYMKDLSKNSSIMALNAGHLPFFLGLFATYFYTRDWLQAIFVGIALAITAEEVAVAILDELNILKKRIGQLIIEAGIIGDVFEIMAITLLGLIIKSQQTNQSFAVFTILFELFAFVLVILIMRYYVINLLLKIPGKKGKKHEYFSVAFVVLMIMVLSSELLNFSNIIGALLAGILLKDKLVEDKLYFQEHHIVEAIEVFNFGVFHPLVFIWIGLLIEKELIFNNIVFGVILTVLALAGKLIGSIIGNYFCKEPLSEGVLIGWGLNARGATELFALLIAKNIGIVTEDVFAAVVFMALVTTIVSPIVFKALVLKGYGLFKHDHREKHHKKIMKKVQHITKN